MKTKPMLLISGPSGGGKSTFISQLKTGTLDKEILKCIPTGADKWLPVEANDILKGRLTIPLLLNESHDATGLLVHYDIAFIHRYELENYDDDAALNLLEHADPLHLVFIRPNTSSLRRQFQHRQQQQRSCKSLISRLWSKYFRLPIRRMLAPLKGASTISSRGIYDTDNWILDCYKRWEKYLARQQSLRPSVTLIIIEPDDHCELAIRFKLVPMA